MRLIDADELRSGLFHLEGETSLTDRQLGYQAGWNDALIYGVLDAPTVDAVKHGHWIERTKAHPDLLNDSTYNYECSNCGYMDTHGANVEVPYCWHCGAKMDEPVK